MNLFNQWKLATNDEFIKKVQQAMIKAAIDVASEELPSPRRASYATQILNNPEYYRTKFAFGAVTNHEITEKCGDNDIQIMVNNIFNAYAGAYKPGVEEPIVKVYGRPWYRKVLRGK